MFPKVIKLIAKKDLKIIWTDDSESIISLMQMRKMCPCATCVAEREKQSSTFIPIFSNNQVTASQIKQVGTYAISIVWNDGHSTGIYEYSFLKRISVAEGY